MRSLVVLLLLLAAQSHAKQDQKPSTQQASAGVPGQAFHDWRTAVVAAKFNIADSSSSSSTNPSAAGHSKATEWVNIVAARERITTIKGPPPRTTPHPNASRRLRIAQALIETAARDADASAAKAAAAAAVTQESTSTAAAAATGVDSTKSHGRHLRLSPPQRSLNQQTGRKLQPQADSSSSSGSSAEEERELLAKLTVLLRQQPYKPLKTDPATMQDTLMNFVHRGPKGRLYVAGKPWLLKGFDVPQALQLAAGGPTPRSQLMYLLDRAQALGLNTLRFRAFADGAAGVGSAVEREWEQQGGSPPQHQDVPGVFDYLALQPAPGVLNNTMLREGIDWLVHEAGLRAIRLLPVLTNGGSAELGGMKQYIDWIDPLLTVTAFYTNDTIKSVFLDYMAALLSHTNALSGIPLREDPVILGWQLADEASHPGQPSSQVLLAWLRQFGVFMRERAPYQLLLPGVKDLFGHNSPHHLQHNPFAQMFAPVSHTPHTYEPRCHGVDFWLHHQLPEMDAALAGVFPDQHLACNTTCKLAWTRGWIRAHLRDALRMNKPLILGGVGALRPQSWRRQVLQLVREEVERALQRDHPIGGFFLSGLSHPDMADASGWSVYYSSKGVHAARPPVANLNAQAILDVKWRRFMNYEALLTCSALQERGTSTDKGEASNTQAWVDGWEDVVHAVAAVGSLPADADLLQPST